MKDLDAVIGYTKQFIEAVAPAAKQAYEVGLLTLRIDAASTVLQSVLIAVLCGAWLWFAVHKERAFEKNKSLMGCWHFEHVIPVFVSIGSIIGVVAAIFSVLNVWLWTKLLAPELWLAHQAVEKLVK